MLTLAAKAPGETLRYTWVPALDCGDSITSAALTVSSGTAAIDSYEHDGQDITMVLSGGASAEITTIDASAVTALGETITETIYLPVVESTNRLGNTARDICYFALRKIAGNDEDPGASELDDALERLNDMLAAWKAQGADVGIPLPVDAGTVLLVPDEFLAAIKANVLLDVFDHYGEQPTQRQAMNAHRGLQLVKASLLPADRAPAEYY